MGLGMGLVRHGLGRRLRQAWRSEGYGFQIGTWFFIQLIIFFIVVDQLTRSGTQHLD